MAMITDTRSIGKISACIVLQPLTSFVEDRCTFVPSASQSVVTRNARKGAKLVEKSIFLPITTRRLSGIEVSLLLKSDISDINSGLEWWEEIQWEVVARRAMTGWRTGRHIESLLDLALGSLPASFTFPVIDCPHMCLCRQQFWTDCLVQVLQYRFVRTSTATRGWILTNTLTASGLFWIHLYLKGLMTVHKLFTNISPNSRNAEYLLMFYSKYLF